MTLTVRQPAHHLHDHRWLTPALITLVVIAGLAVSAGAALRLIGSAPTAAAPTTVAPLIVTVPEGQGAAALRLAFTGRGVDGALLPTVAVPRFVAPAGVSFADARLAFTGRQASVTPAIQPSAAGQRAAFHSLEGF